MRFKKLDFTLGLFFGLCFFSCTSRESTSENHCAAAVPITDFEPAEDLKITAPDDFGGTIRESAIFQDTLAYFLSDRPKMKVKIVDLKNRQFIDEVPLDPNFFDFPSGIQVHSKDSIFVSDFNFPAIRLINSQGEILDTYNLYKEDLWKMPQEGFANFGLYGGFGIDFQYIPERNSFLVPLRQIDQWYFIKEKKDFPAIGEYSLKSQDFVRVFAKYEGMYASEENFLLPFYLSHPIIERVGNQIILSFSLDPNLYLYSIEGEFLGKKCASISEFTLSEPLNYDMNGYDSEGIMDYNSKNSYFGDFFYITQANRFVRYYWKCDQDAQGNCKSKKAFALVFDRDLTLLEVREMNDTFNGNEFMFFMPYQLGFLSKSLVRESDDEFILNSYYSLQ
jgi:hypothetical protein